MLVSLADSSEVPPPDSVPTADAAGAVPGSHTRAPIIGDSLALLSALVYALYVTLLKVRVRSESRVDMQLFFGFVGLFNVISCWMMGLLPHVTGVEPFELPTTRAAVVAILINVFIL